MQISPGGWLTIVAGPGMGIVVVKALVVAPPRFDIASSPVTSYPNISEGGLSVSEPVRSGSAQRQVMLTLLAGPCTLATASAPAFETVDGEAAVTVAS